jgi:hypothetical protein
MANKMSETTSHKFSSVDRNDTLKMEFLATKLLKKNCTKQCSVNFLYHESKSKFQYTIEYPYVDMRHDHNYVYRTLHYHCIEFILFQSAVNLQ